MKIKYIVYGGSNLTKFANDINLRRNAEKVVNRMSESDLNSLKSRGVFDPMYFHSYTPGCAYTIALMKSMNDGEVMVYGFEGTGE